VREEEVAYDRRSLIVWYVSDRRHEIILIACAD
jgi:hypothetical protein